MCLWRCGGTTTVWQERTCGRRPQGRTGPPSHTFLTHGARARRRGAAAAVAAALLAMPTPLLSLRTLAAPPANPERIHASPKSGLGQEESGLVAVGLRPAAGAACCVSAVRATRKCLAVHEGAQRTLYGADTGAAGRAGAGSSVGSGDSMIIRVQKQNTSARERAVLCGRGGLRSMLLELYVQRRSSAVNGCAPCSRLGGGPFPGL